jgi:hypothetical protein
MLIVVVVDSGNAPIVEAKDDRVLPLQRDPASLSGGAHGEEHSAGVQIVNLSRQEPKDTRVHRASEGEVLLSCPSQDGRQTFLKAGENSPQPLRAPPARRSVGRQASLPAAPAASRARAGACARRRPAQHHPAQLGHTNLGTTSIYLQGIDPEEIIAAVRTRRAPMMSASAGLRL